MVAGVSKDRPKVRGPAYAKLRIPRFNEALKLTMSVS
jgi:hypothetical protein